MPTSWPRCAALEAFQWLVYSKIIDFFAKRRVVCSHVCAFLWSLLLAGNRPTLLWVACLKSNWKARLFPAFEQIVWGCLWTGAKASSSRQCLWCLSVLLWLVLSSQCWGTSFVSWALAGPFHPFLSLYIYIYVFFLKRVYVFLGEYFVGPVRIFWNIALRYPTFLKYWNAKWTLILKFRAQSEFATCDVCQELKAQPLCSCLNFLCTCKVQCM